MDRKYNGCQAVIREWHPLALHFRCASHSIHLVAQHATEADILVRDCLQWVQDLGKLYKRSTKFHRPFENVAADAGDGPHSSSTMKPLCPTDTVCCCCCCCCLLLFVVVVGGGGSGGGSGGCGCGDS